MTVTPAMITDPKSTAGLAVRFDNVSIVFGDSPEKALDNDFQNLAADVFGPLLKHRKKTG